MAQEVRQSNLLAGEDWQVIYRAFTEVNFNAYDFDSLRASMVDYIRINFPEDFNDYIQSSEFIAIIDLLAYLGQNLAFRMDLNTRENFIDTAERRESLLRLARLINYQPSRNRAANGLVKVTSVKTNEDLIDSNGENLSNQTVLWNDLNNPDWFEQFILVMNAAFINRNSFGVPVKEQTVNNIPTQLYQFNNLAGTGPVQSFNANVSGVNVDFEFINAVFDQNEGFYELQPDLNDSQYVIYRSDGNGNSSPNTGFFFMFKQGTLSNQDVQFEIPVENRILPIDVEDINDNDVYVQEVTDSGNVIANWRKVPAIVGNNVVYNDLQNEVRNIFSVITRDNDQVSIRFPDGRFGSVPVGNFRFWYRTSFNGRLRIRPRDIADQEINIPYTNPQGQQFTLTLTVQLQETIDNSAPSESNEQIRQRAPQVYYTQNRMVNGQDYNVFPLQTSQAVKVKAVNRTYSGHSRYIDIEDPTGSQQNVKVFSDDGILYYDNTEFIEEELSLPSNRSPTEIFVSKLIPIFQNLRLTNYFYTDYIEQLLLRNTDNVVFNYRENKVPHLFWEASTTSLYSSTGRIRQNSVVPDNIDDKLGDAPIGSPVQVNTGDGGVITDLIQEGSLLLFKNAGWVSVKHVRGLGDIISNSGKGAITLDQRVPTNDLIVLVLPTFRTSLNQTEKGTIINSIQQQITFGLRYDFATSKWKVINKSNLDITSSFSLQYAGDNSNQGLDSSWLILVEFSGNKWRFTARSSKFIFESLEDVRFFFLNRYAVVDGESGRLARDNIKVFETNSSPDPNDPNANLERSYYWKLISEIIEEDGYIEPRRVEVTFLDSDFDGIPDDPVAFQKIVLGDIIDDPNEPSGKRFSVPSDQRYIFQERYLDKNNIERWKPLFNITTFNSNNYSTGERIYGANLETGSLLFNTRFGTYYENKSNSTKPRWGTNDLEKKYKRNRFREFIGRSNIDFKWQHYAPNNHRLNPSITNIVDVFILEENYDNAIREWLANNGDETTKPEAPSSEDLRLIFGDLEQYKMVTDEIIWRPVTHKILFGEQAKPEVRATFKVIKVSNTDLSNQEIKSQIVQIIDEFFNPVNWDFGETFYFSELSAFIHSRLPTVVASIVLVPVNEASRFGNLFEIPSESNELFISAATVNDIEIIDNNTETNLRVSG